jgi:histidine triad (HIT) family protein
MMSEACPFCAIIRREAPADIVYETEQALVIRDLNPQAPMHLLVIPRRHIRTLNEADPAVVASLYTAAREAVEREGYAEQGYRTVINVHRLAGQSVWHLHLHVLAGRPMRWPPG